MKAKTLIELLTLSSNLYLISKDKELLERLGTLAEKGKKKVNELVGDISSDEHEHELIEKIVQKAKQAKEELEHKMEEVATAMYRKMHIAHADEVRTLNEQVETLKRELALTESRLINLENTKKS